MKDKGTSKPTVVYVCAGGDAGKAKASSLAEAPEASGLSLQVMFSDGIAEEKKPLWERESGRKLFAALEAGNLPGWTLLCFMEDLGAHPADVRAAVDRLAHSGMTVVAVHR